MDRAIVYSQEMAQDTDILRINKNAMVGLGWLMQAILGTSTYLDGLPCTPGAGLTVNVGAGAIYFQEQTDATGFGSLGTDSTLLVKQGLSLTTTNLSVPAIGSAGQSTNYLIEVQYQDVDSGSTVLPYYNSANPLVPFSGPGNSGNPQMTIRQGVCALQVKAGTPATTGSQVTPTPDSGWTGAWVVTVDFGESSLVSNDIVAYTPSSFINPKLTGFPPIIQSGQFNTFTDTGVVNALAITPSPAVTALTDGLWFFIHVAHTNTGGTTLNVSGLGATAVQQNGGALGSGVIAAGQKYLFVYDAASAVWQLLSPASSAPGLPTASTSTAGITKYSTNALAAAMVDAASALTPANLGSIFTQLMSVNGYLSMPGGLVEQWGLVDFGFSAPEGLYGPYTFPLAFPTNCFNLELTTLTPETTGSGSAGDNVIMVSNGNRPTTTQFYAWNNSIGSGGSNTARGFYWTAKGN